MPSNPYLLSLLGLAGCSVAMSLAWGAGLRLRFFSLVDAVWAYGIAGCAVVYSACFGASTLRSELAALLACVWGVRLGSHLALRLWRQYPSEDGRYDELRRQWGSGVAFRSFLFFQAQGLSQAVLAFPFAAAALDSEPGLRALEIAGAAIALLGVAGETLADSQLKHFKADPSNRGRVCDRGLWSWSRHPNYFFESLVWIGFGLFGASSAQGLASLACPVAMLGLLLFVTGVPPAEAQSLQSRGDAYRRYQERTSRFVPWPPRSRSDRGASHVD